MGDIESQAGCTSGQHSTGVGGDGWYRFVGTGGDALPLNPPSTDHCGTNYGGWLSGSLANGEAPPRAYTVGGRYPRAVEGVVDMTTCFSNGRDGLELIIANPTSIWLFGCCR